MLTKFKYLFIFFHFTILAQQNGIVAYSYSFHPEKLNLNKELKDAPKMEMTWFMKLTEAYAKQHRYILKFTPKEAYFEVEAGAQPDDLLDPGAWRISQWSFGAGVFYQNAQKRYILNQKTSWGKEYLVKDTIQNDWTIQYEKRIIGGYKCYKAIKKPNRPKGFTAVAWFTPEIPVPFGPSRFAGTPGLILELNYGPHTLNLKKITFKKELKITKPSKGKPITKDELDMLNFKKKMELYQKAQRKHHK